MVTPTNYGNNPFQPGMSQDVFVPDQLIAGDLKVVTKTGTIAAGAGVLKRGTVLGQISSDGTYKTALLASSDGSQTPVVILADDVDASGAAVLAGLYQMGEFNGNAVILGTGITLAAATTALELKNIYLKTSVSAADPT
ncbi:head decoration protein [uncultured Novosphingobium sp.]|uniref:head decoration protein n=1 Tax=uncultured Novosphingobium sp. TaxID=292277 RepID=UPI002592DFB8|nr:head decoration protein [uncultured Novosphingobium sp.]